MITPWAAVSKPHQRIVLVIKPLVCLITVTKKPVVVTGNVLGLT
jgi:hypothetical protein